MIGAPRDTRLSGLSRLPLLEWGDPLLETGSLSEQLSLRTLSTTIPGVGRYTAIVSDAEAIYEVIHICVAIG